jgi:tetratricopeptide (TPR) repeat protein
MKRSLLSTCLLALACQAPAAPAPAAIAATTSTAPAATAAVTTVVTAEATRAPVLRHADELARIDAEIAAVLARAQAQPRGWLVLEQAANLHLTRARLSGDHDDYAQAEQLVDRAFAVAGPGAGPYFTRVRLDFTLHRLDRVARDLETIAGFAIPSDEDRRALVALRADLAFQRGRYAEALQGFEQALVAREDVTGLAQLALYRWKTGDFLAAEDLYHRALARLRSGAGEPLAWLHLQLGLMDLERGRHDEALAHYRDGAAELGGYWLLDEHIAEILTLQGNTDEALAAYADILRRTHNPEFMDAVAAIHLAAGRSDDARRLIAETGKIYEAQLLRFPEAAHGHALAHFLEFGDDPARTLTIAEANHRTRPNAEAKISLARAYLGAGRVDAAQTILAEALATPWNTADLHAAAAEVYTAAGDVAAADKARARARAIDPTCCAPAPGR